MNAFLDLFLSLTFYLIPLLIGLFFTYRIYFAYIYGIIIWYLFLSLVILITDFFNFKNYSSFFIQIFSLILLISSVRRALKINFSHHIFSFNFFLKHSFLITAILISTLNYFLVFKINTPYPLQLNWDIYEHITLSNQIAEGNFSFITSKISDTFTYNSYSPIFHSLLAIPKILFNSNLIGIYWWLEYFHFLLTITIIYFLSLKIFNNNLYSFLSATISNFIFASSVSYIPLFLLPQTFSSLLAIIYFLTILNFSPLLKNGRRLKEVLTVDKIYFIPPLVIILTHYIIGFASIFLIFFYILLNRLNLSSQKTRLVITLSLFLLLITILSNLLFNIDLTAREEAGYFNPPLLEKISLFLDWYSLSIIIFFISGFLYINKCTEKMAKDILIISLLSLSLTLLPIAYFLKFFTISYFFVNLVLVFGIIYFLPKVINLVQVSLIAWILLIFFITFYINQRSFKKDFYYQGFYSHISDSEIEAAFYLKQKYPKDSFLVSDPATQYILEAVSGINTQGGAYMKLESRDKISQLANETDIKNLEEILRSVNDRLQTPKKQTLLVLSGRYFAWQKLPNYQKKSFYYNIWRPTPINQDDLGYINQIAHSTKIVYQNKEMVILEF